MKHIRLFENFKPLRQPLDKIDIRDLLNDIGINILDIQEDLIRYNNEFWLGWKVKVDEPDFMDLKIRNYEWYIEDDFIHFVYIKEYTKDELLSFITYRWKEILDWLLPFFKDMEGRIYEKYPDIIYWFKEDKFLFEHDIKNKVFWVSRQNIWLKLEYEFAMQYNKIQQFLWIILEDITNYKVFTTVFSFGLHLNELEQITDYKVVTTKSKLFHNPGKWNI